jgi:hypothetical protein
VISKALRGSDIGGLVRYLFGPGRANEHTDQRVVACSDPTWTGTMQPDAATVRQLIAELRDPMVRHGDSTKDGYVYHVAVSLPAEDGQLADAQWQQVAQRFADKLGFDNQVHWVAINHGLTVNGNDHLHFVVNLIRDDTGRAQKLPYDRMRRREACIELEERFGLTATAPAGQGQTSSLSRREVEALRAGRVSSVADLSQHRVATLVRAVAAGARSEGEFVERLRGEGLVVRARYARDDRNTVTGYSVAAKTGGHEPLVWYGGGRLGKELRLPALRTKWGQTDEQRKAAATAWFSDAATRRKAEPRNLAGAAEALREAAARLQKVPPEDRFSWYVAASESAGVIAAAANTTTDDRVRRELIRALQAINRATPVATSLDVEVAPGDAAQLRLVESGQSGDHQAHTRPAAAWPEPTVRPAAQMAEVSALLGGASRVLMAARLADAPDRVRVQALVVQAIELAAQISRTIAAREDATAAQHRAAEATTQAAATTTAATRTGGWQFTKTGSEILEAARGAGPAPAELGVDDPQPVAADRSVDPPEQAR